MKFIVEVLMGVCSLAYNLASYFSHRVLGSFQTVRAKTFYSNTFGVGLGVLTLNFLHRYLGVGVGVGVGVELSDPRRREILVPQPDLLLVEFTTTYQIMMIFFSLFNIAPE